MLQMANLESEATNSASISDIVNYVPVLDNGSDVYVIDMQNKPFIKVSITPLDADAKAVTVINCPARAEIFLELTYTNAAAITWTMKAGSTTFWLTGSAPTLTATKTYRMSFFTLSTGTTWHNTSVGGW